MNEESDSDSDNEDDGFTDKSAVTKTVKVNSLRTDLIIKTVSRIELLSAKVENDLISVKLRRFKSLTIENYSDPWKDSSQEA
ncbi:hypothetical protein C0J52_01751 [Blattella germanica]|nr:hypothetical protein C0J52_01751 [Blattella germanica]